MFVSENLSINDNGNLTFGGVDTVKLAEQYGTPLYVMDEKLVRQHCRSFKNSIDKFYGGNGLVCYASKAFSCTEMCRIVKDEGIGIDVVSIGELYTALKAGFDTSKIGFHGNNKTNQELEFAVENKVGHIIVDNIEELERLDKIAETKGGVADIMFRIKPGIDAHTHDFVKTGQIDSKFGIALETGEAFDAVKSAISLKNVNLLGVHCHIGSQIFDIAPFEEAARVMLTFIAKIKNELGFEVKELNLGGGFGIKYTENDTPVAYENYMERVSAVVHNTCKELNINLPFILIEPGRSIAGPAGITLYTVGARKVIPNIRTYVSSVVEEIFEKDIKRRVKIRNRSTYEKVKNYVINNFGATTSFTSMQEALEKDGISIKRETLNTYIQTLVDSKILYECKRFDMKSKKSLTGDKKYYLSDTSFYFATNTDNRINFGPVLENMTYIYAKSCGYQVSVGRIGNLECDFILRDKKQNYSYVQVAYTILESKKTEDREYRPLENIKDNYPKYVATTDYILQNRNGIQHINILDFIKQGRPF